MAQLVDIKAVAEQLGTTHRHIRGLVDERKIPFTKVGRLIRFDPAKIEKWIEQNSVSA
jgi:excisionase family DNA binding protein